MKSFSQFLAEDTPFDERMHDPYDWDANYGKRYKFITTPESAKTPENKNKPSVSLVTPANRDLWNEPSITGDALETFKRNWNPESIGVHKQYQIETGKPSSVDDFTEGGRLHGWSSNYIK